MIHTCTALRILSLIPALLLANCASKLADTAAVTKPGEKFVNPFPPGTYKHFTAEPDYPKTKSVWKDDSLLSKTDAGNSSVRIDVAKQRGYLMNAGDIVMDYPVCTGRSGHETPEGEFHILEKTVDKRSNRYGRIYDAAGDCVNSDADTTKDTIPEGGRFEGASMRYWMRLTNDGVGHHIAPLPRSRRPASHGCVRGPSNAIPIVYSKVKLGTKVTVE